MNTFVDLDQKIAMITSIEETVFSYPPEWGKPSYASPVIRYKDLRYESAHFRKEFDEEKKKEMDLISQLVGSNKIKVTQIRILNIDGSPGGDNILITGDQYNKIQNHISSLKPESDKIYSLGEWMDDI